MGKYLILALAFCACVQDGPDPENPALAMVETNQARWSQVAGKSYSITFEEATLEDTATIACEAVDGRIGQCTRVHNCCGKGPDTTTVSGYDTPGEILADLKQEVVDFQDQGSNWDKSSFALTRTGEKGTFKLEKLEAAFDTTYGYPKRIFRYGPDQDIIKSITSFQLK